MPLGQTRVQKKGVRRCEAALGDRQYQQRAAQLDNEPQDEPLTVSLFDR
jgi:hypothetical protein